MEILKTDFLLQAADEFYSKLEGQKIDLKALQQVCSHPRVGQLRWLSELQMLHLVLAAWGEGGVISYFCYGNAESVVVREWISICVM